MSDIGDMIEGGSPGPEWQNRPHASVELRHALDTLATLRAENARLQEALARYYVTPAVAALEAENARLRGHIKDQGDLLVCYRLGKRPSEKLLDRLAKFAALQETRHE